MKLPGLLKNFPGMAYRALNDGHWSIEFISDGCRDVLGLGPQQLRAQGKTSLVDILRHNQYRHLDDTDLSGNLFEFEYVLTTPAGDERRVIERGFRVYDENGALVAIEGFVTKVSERHRRAADTVQRPSYDQLTGLASEHYFETAVQAALDRPDTETSAHSLVYVDLDQSKLFNQSGQNSQGDELLRQVAVCLRNRLRRSDTLARLGTDEFGLLLENCSLDDATRIASMLCDAVAEKKFKFQQRRYSLTVSIGVASTSEGLDSFQKLMEAAEIARIAAKDCGQNRVHYYLQQDALLLHRNQDIHWALEIPKAIAENRFFLQQQTIIPLAEPATATDWHELLIRMHDIDGNVVMPARFLPAAERYNLATTIDTWIVEIALQNRRRAAESQNELGLCFIKISAQSIGDPTFAEKICLLQEQYQVSANCLCLEFAESAALANREQALQMMRQLQKIGCRFTLDNFGSGLSSLGLLRDFPVDFIKIDGNIVTEIEQNTEQQSILSSINEVSRIYNKKIIASSVESDEIVSQLREIGIDYALGNAIAPPSPLLFDHAENMEAAS